MPTYRCRFCHSEFAWEDSSYPLLWSRILVHLGMCRDAAALTSDERSVEARRAADAILGFPKTADQARREDRDHARHPR